MLSVNQISKSYGIQPVLIKVSFSATPGERLGLVGPNGSGKTTLLRIIAGEEKPDSGSALLTPASARVGYLPQGFSFLPDETLGGFLARMEGDLDGLSARLEALGHALAAAPDDSALQAEYDEVLARLSLAAENAGRGPGTLAALGLGHLPPDLPAASLSGGQKTRLGLAGVLLSAPQLLLLDEPTNHLDFDMLDWLEGWLNDFRGAAVVVSHDRVFLDNVATGILDLDAARHSLRAYPGNYSDYLDAKLADQQRQWQSYTDQQDEIARLQGAARHLRGIARFRKGGKADSGDKFAKGFFANRGKDTIGRAKHIEAHIERLLGEEHIDKPRAEWQMRMAFGETPQSGRDVLVLEDLSVGYPGVTLLEHLDGVVRYGARLALIGPNGSGKTSLLRTIAGQLQPLAGRARLGSGVRLGYMAQEQEDLDPALNPLQTIQRAAAINETAARAFLSQYLFKGDEVFTPVGALSYGERARLSLARLVAQGCNFLILDEPVNHLDIPSRSRFEQALAGFEGSILAVAHDRFFIASFASMIWEVTGRKINEYEALSEAEAESK